VVGSDVEWRDVVALETHQLDLPGVSIQVRPRRFYPHGPLAAHLLGYVGEVSERELSERGDELELRPGDYVGKAGLERVWDEELRGVVGGQQVEVDALGRRVRVIQEVPDVAGDTLVLTLDADLQEAAGQAMGERRGSCVALDPRNGEVLAMVSKPDYDPNLFARGIQRSEWQQLIGDEWRPLTNRAVQGQYAPGSIFKVAVAAGLLDAGVVNRTTGYTCTGGTQLGNRLFRCWKRGGHGYVNLHRAIMQSCDVFFYQAGQRLGVDGIAEYSHRFGLGEPTGIGLSTEESGLIPTRAWKQRRFGAPWYPGETLPVAIGQGYVTVTPLQMASMVAMIANGGTHYRPHYVRRLEAPDGTVKREIRPEVMGYANIAPEHIEAVRSGMRDVVMAPGGTGRNGQVPGIEVAGKTGTAQVVRLKAGSRGNDGPERTRDHAWFIAFAPVAAPEIAVACLAEHAGGGGGAIAAPIVSKILTHYFERGQGPVLPPDHEHAHADRSTTSHTL
jgi:penicillin-binding protein 2